MDAGLAGGTLAKGGRTRILLTLFIVVYTAYTACKRHTRAVWSIRIVSPPLGVA